MAIEGPEFDRVRLIVVPHDLILFSNVDMRVPVANLGLPTLMFISALLTDRVVFKSNTAAERDRSNCASLPSAYRCTDTGALSPQCGVS